MKGRYRFSEFVLHFHQDVMDLQLNPLVRINPDLL